MEVNFYLLSVQTEDLQSTSSTFCTARRPSVNICFVFVQPADLPSTSVKILCDPETLCKLPSTFHAAGRTFVNLVNFLYGWETFVNICELAVTQGDLPSTSVNIPCHQKTFRQLPSTFCVAKRLSINFSLLPVQRETFRPLPSAYHVATKLSVNFR